VIIHLVYPDGLSLTAACGQKIGDGHTGHYASSLRLHAELGMDVLPDLSEPVGDAMSIELTEQERDDIAAACDAALDFGAAWVRFLRNGDESMLLPVILAAKAEAWDEGCRATEQFYKRSVIGLPGIEPIDAPINPYQETP
jgi:hypothetical protein